MPEVAHSHRGVWMAVALGLVGVATLGIALYSRFAAAEPAPIEVTLPEAKPVLREPQLAPVKPPGSGKWSALEGAWHGIGDQPDLAITWSVDIQLEKIGAVGTKVGVIKFGSPLGCSGELERMADDDDTLVLHETMTSDPNDRCVAEATLRLKRDGDKVSAVWIYVDGRQAATGDLTR